MSNKKQQYVLPKNIVFIMGPSFTINYKILHALENLYNDNEQYLFLEDESFYSEIRNTTMFSSSDLTSIELFKFGSSMCTDYLFKFADLCELAKNNPDKLVITAICPFDGFILFHAWDYLKLISKDAHYMLCNLLSDIIAPWSMVDYNVVLIYPELYTLLTDMEEADTSFIEQLHLLYHTYFINNIAAHLKNCKVIDKSKMTNRMQELIAHLDELYKNNTTDTEDSNILVHPILHNENIFMNNDKELQEVQKTFDAKKKDDK